MSIAAPCEDEPDSFRMTASGLPARGRRHQIVGNWCGYVGVPKSYPLYGLKFRQAVPYPAEFMERPLAIKEVGVMGLLHAVATHQTWGEGRADQTDHHGAWWNHVLGTIPR